jgi:XRE family transcriptional regulator, regulator of sulfur utilization
MMTVGDKIRGARLLKGFSQENMADMMNLSVLAYGEIERGNDIKVSRLDQIAEKLGVSTAKILGFEDTVSNFFDRCTTANVATGPSGSNQTTNNYDQREIQNQLEKAQLELKNSHLENDNLRLKLEKAEAELKYWKEKSE